MVVPGEGEPADASGRHQGDRLLNRQKAAGPERTGSSSVDRGMARLVRIPQKASMFVVQDP
jgi:hypothetical protein